MDISEKAAKYIFRSILTICITFIICTAIYAFSNRYDSYPTSGGGEYHATGYLVDTWTGQTWRMLKGNISPISVDKE